MDKKISQLTAATTPLTGAEELAIVQSGVTKKTTIEDVKGYKVYTALLTQSGGDNVQYINSGSLTIGVTYELFDEPPDGWDFTNVGAPNNLPGTKFVATGTTPAKWGTQVLGNNTLAYNTGAPVVTVLENTIGNIWFTYDSVGFYLANSNGLFTVGKSWTPTIMIFNDSAGLQDGEILQIQPSSQSIYSLASYNQSGTQIDGKFNNTPIEIRVYN